MNLNHKETKFSIYIETYNVYFLFGSNFSTVTCHLNILENTWMFSGVIQCCRMKGEFKNSIMTFHFIPENVNRFSFKDILRNTDKETGLIPKWINSNSDWFFLFETSEHFLIGKMDVCNSLPYKAEYSVGQQSCKKCDKKIRSGALKIAIMMQVT